MALALHYAMVVGMRVTLMGHPCTLNQLNRSRRLFRTQYTSMSRLFQRYGCSHSTALCVNTAVFTGVEYLLIIFATTACSTSDV